MKSSKILSLVGLGALSLVSCIDNGYDLNNIDKTVQVGVNELVIPINIDSISLDQVMDLDSASRVKRVKDPSTGDSIYAVVEEGTFKSKDIDIKEFSSEKPETSDIDCDISLKKLKTELDKFVTDTLTIIARREGLPYTDPKIQTMKAEVQKIVWQRVADKDTVAMYSIGLHMTTFDTPVIKVHKAIRAIEEIGTDCVLDVDVEFQNLDFLDNVCCKNIKIQMPVGLGAIPSAGTYDSTTGVLDLSNDGKGIVVKSGHYKFSLQLTSINLAEGSGAKFTPKKDAEGEFRYSTVVKILSGDLMVCKDNFVGDKNYFNLPTQARFLFHPDMSEIDIASFTGDIDYSVDSVGMKSISLSDLPGVITGDETDLILKNPQVYLTVNNPLTDYNLYAQADVALTPRRDGADRETTSLDDGALRLDEASNLFCLSPMKPSKYYDGFADAEWKSFKGLSTMLSGHGIPDVVAVEIKNPGVPQQRVENFLLGKNYGPIEGKYLFYAPLDLDEYSIIVYEDKETGWNDDGSLDNLSITQLQVKADVTSSAPLGAKLTLTAIDKDGNAIPGVDFNAVELSAYAKDQQVVFKQQSGTITGLDGISIRASIASDGSKALQPQQSLKLKNVRVTVTGTYTDSL